MTPLHNLKNTTQGLSHQKVVCVFCGHLPGHPHVSEDYRNEARQITRAIVENQCTVLTGGGGGKGIMNTVTKEALNLHGHTIQVIPDFLLQREGLISNHNNTSFIVKSMEERKHIMFSKSHAFLLLYGGIGSLDEFFEIVTAIQLGIIPKTKAPLVIYNHNQYWTPLLHMIENMIQNGFLPEKDRELFVFCNTINDCLHALNLNSTLSE